VGIKFTIDNKGVIDYFGNLEKIPKQLIEEAYDVFKENTPVKSGKSRNSTYLGGNQIRADYLYAGRLDDGYSKQSPDGMTKPTFDFIEKRLNELVEKK
jgi:hypothetical protein